MVFRRYGTRKGGGDALTAGVYCGPRPHRPPVSGGGTRAILFRVTTPTAPHDWPQTTPILDGLLTRPPVWGGRFPGSYNRQGLPRWSCSHACCGHGMEMFTRSPVRTRSPLLTLALPPWWVPLAAGVAVACFLNRRVPVLRWCGAHPATVRGRTPRDVSGK